MSELEATPMFNEARYAFVTTIILWLLVAPSATAQTSFAIIGDYGTGSANEGYVASLVYGWNTDFIISLGDNRYGSADFDETVGQLYCDSLTDAGSGSWCSGGNSQANAFFPSLGNHDYTDGTGLNEYLNYFTLPGTGVVSSGTSGSERYYDFIRGPVHFFVIDSQGVLNSAPDKTSQMNWLQAQLAASSAPWKVVYFHHAPYSSSGGHGSNPEMQWPFASWGADAVLSGHDHTYERIFADGIVYFVNGLGGDSIYGFVTPVSGSQLRYNGDHGAMRVEASNTAISFEFISLSGSIIDTYTLQAAPNIAPNAAFTYSCTDLICSFTDASSDSDGSVTAWSWGFGDGGSSSTASPSHTYAAAGTYNVTLTVTDSDGGSDSVTQSVTVTAPTLPPAAPNAAFTYSCTDLSCSFTDASSDSDGSVTAWSWGFGDNNSSTTQHPSHRYTAAGTYAVALTVTDNTGKTHSTSQSVTVVTTSVGAAAVPQTGDSGGGGGGCTIRKSDASVDSSWLLMIIGLGIGFMRQRLIKY